MGIDISKLTGELKFLARLSDKNENNIIDDENEYSIFKGHADVELKAGNISEEEYKKIFGLESSASKPVETVKTASTVVTKPVTLSKKDEKRNRNAVKDSVEELVKNGTAPKDLIAQLRKEYQNPEYNKYINEVESMLNMIPAYNSKEDVEKIHDSVKEQLKSADKWDGFHKDILGYLEEQAETAQIEKEYEGLVRRYSDIKKTMAGTELVKQQGDNFKAYVEILKDELQTKGADGKKEWNKSYTKEAFDYLEEYAKQDAKDVVESRLEDTTGTSSRKIKKELKLQNKGKDDYQSDAIGDIKTERKIFARKNQVEKTAIDLENINREDLRKELGKELFEKLNRKYLGTVMNENGTYNLSKLSDEILTRVGADYKVNQSKDKEMAELTNIERHLEAIMNTDLTEKEKVNYQCVLPGGTDISNLKAPFYNVQFFTQDFSNASASMVGLSQLVQSVGFNLVLRMLDVDNRQAPFQALVNARLVDYTSNVPDGIFTTVGMNVFQYPESLLEEYFTTKLLVEKILERWSDNGNFIDQNGTVAAVATLEARIASEALRFVHETIENTVHQCMGNQFLGNSTFKKAMEREITAILSGNYQAPSVENYIYSLYDANSQAANKF